MCVAVPTLFDRFIGYSVLVSQLSSLCSFARTAHTHNTNTQSTHGHIHRFACLLAYTTTTYLGCCFLGPELFAPVVNRSITINIFNVLFRCLFIKTLLFLSWYRRGAALLFPKILHDFSLSLFIYGIFSFNISFFTSFFFSFDLNNKFTHQTQVIFHKYTVFMTIYRINMWLTHSFAHTHRERERERETEVRTLPKSTFMITFQYH